MPATISGVRVMFDGTPAALLYVSAGQINAIVTYEVSGQSQTSVVVTLNGQQTANIQQAVANTSPGIFQLDYSARPQGAIINANGTVNGQRSPAIKGTTIALFGTGEGQTNPAGVTASITGTKACAT
jgi:uncharacterized protein (TIGR03437 family)